jgi:hypothetical protein
MQEISMYDNRSQAELIEAWHILFYRHCRSIISLQIDRGNGAFNRNYKRFLGTFNKLYNKDPLAISYYIDSIYERGFDFYYLYYYFNASKVYIDKKNVIDQIAMHERGKSMYRELQWPKLEYSQYLDDLPSPSWEE